METANGASWARGTVVGVFRNGTITPTEPFRPLPSPHQTKVAALFPACMVVHSHRPRWTGPPNATLIAHYARARFPRAYSQRWPQYPNPRQVFGFVGSRSAVARIRADLGRRFPEWSFCVARVRHRRLEYQSDVKRLGAAQEDLTRRGIRLTGWGGGQLDHAEATVEVADSTTLRYLRHRFPLVTFTSQIRVLGAKS